MKRISHRLLVDNPKMVGRRKISISVKLFEYIVVFAIFLFFQGLFTLPGSSKTPLCQTPSKNPAKHINSELVRTLAPLPAPAGDKEAKRGNGTTDVILSTLRNISRELQEAKLLATDGWTDRRLQRSLLKMADLFNLIKQESPDVAIELPGLDQGEKEHVPLNVCPEVYKGSLYGYPFFNTGFVPENCSYAKPIHTLATVLLNFYGQNSPIDSVSRVLRGIENSYPQMAVYLALDTAANFSTGDFQKLRITVFSGEQFAVEGRIWDFLLQKVTTKYAFIGRHLTHFTNDSRLERLIRVAETLNVSYVGGAWRTPDGHWNMGCHQTLFKNWTVTYRAGYFHSKKECVYCGYLSGPFLADTHALRTVKFDKSMPTGAVFEDLFLRVRSSRVSCPDAMFYVEDTSHKYSDRALFLPLAAKWNINKLNFASGVSHSFTCAEAKVNCGQKKDGYAVAPCCLENLADAVNFFMTTCETNNFLCELSEGTLLGAVKFSKVLPWERDADLVFHTANFSALGKLQSEFAKRGYSFTNKGVGSVWCCVDGRKAGGKIQISAGRGWSVETSGLHLMDSEILIQEGLAPTKVFFAGQWVAVSRNPGLHARNRYGKEIYRHAQHWWVTGKSSGWAEYDTSKFTQCSSEGHHACLDQYLTDGNIQFEGRDL